MKLKQHQYNLINNALNTEMINLHPDEKKIATDLLLKLSKQIKKNET